ncbi:hypothetical protein E2R68_08280 [Psychromonas sp. RZ22]|uniref:cytochrome b562 n=1 Tax=Psychromonas algarum TaxID=2555643 RepID=UPI0010675B45|nr:cytochrome b562 [Psychromonas sp. RZ22]TEW54686.1 hypothetical protein E2R68_08280 [Psychromonas sp. RZ22]
MNMKKSKLVLALSGALFMTLPMNQAFAHDDHCEIKDTKLGDTMKYMKSELRGYTKGFKSADQKKMQRHLNELLKLSEQAGRMMPVTIAQLGKGDLEKIDYSKMDHDKSEMTEQQREKQAQYVEGIERLHALFQALNESKDKAEIESILDKIKQQTKEGHKEFRQDC